jgi:hypothetical protein
LKSLRDKLWGVEERLSEVSSSNMILKAELQSKQGLQESQQTAAESCYPGGVQSSLYLENEQLRESCAMLEKELKAIITRAQEEAEVQVCTLGEPELYPRSLGTGCPVLFLPHGPGTYLPAIREQPQLYRLSLTECFSEKQRQLLQECALVVCGRVARVTCEGEVQLASLDALLGFEEDDFVLRNYA